MQSITELSQRWNDLLRSIDIEPGDVSNTAFILMVDMYTSPLRHYHTLDHVAACLREYDAHVPTLDKTPELEMALWLHDIIYESPAQDNEIRSAYFAHVLLAAIGASVGFAERVGDLIVATRYGSDEREYNRQEQLIRDIDFSTLGKPEEEYRKYRSEIKDEYALFTNTRGFNKGRLDFLREIMKRKSLYHTEEFGNLYAEQARLNIWREMSRLEMM